MAHMLDETTGRAAMAYVGERPWHGLGANLEAGQPIEVWRKAAGLDYEVIRTPVMYDREGHGMTKMAARDVLYRSDTGMALSTIGKDYKIVQPSEVLDFFGKLAEIGGFEMETAGALSDGKRVWALAKVSEGAPVIGQDVVRPYILLATSYDGTLATTAKFTAVRVVCHNTLTMSVGGSIGNWRVSGEEASEEGPVVSQVRIPHSNTFDAEKVRLSLGIVDKVWDRWLIEARMLADKGMTSSQAEVFSQQLLDSLEPKDIHKRKDVTKSKGYESLMGLFTGKSLIGEEMTGGMNRWRMLQAVTEHVDHHRGRSPSTRMTSAWFGVGEGLKNRAFELLNSEDEFTKLVPA